MKLLDNELFYCQNIDRYPPFKNGLYLEEYIFHHIKTNNVELKRKYIPALWTNLQLKKEFYQNKQTFQNSLDKWVQENPSTNGYFAVVQFDNGILLDLPPNTLIYGACSGHIPIPLIYEDNTQTLSRVYKKSFEDKQILCSFVGSITSNHIQPNVRATLFRLFQNNPNFKMINSGQWTANVNASSQITFIDTTINSKFALAPRGFGRSSFRFFECFLLGTIPVYVYNDENWLPFKDKINYQKLCIVLHISHIHVLENDLNQITPQKYQAMWDYYHSIKHLFELEGMTNEFISQNM